MAAVVPSCKNARAFPMNTYIDQFASMLAEYFVIEIEHTVDGIRILCRDLEGNLITSRTFTAKQLRNGPLVSLVLTHLRNTLFSGIHNPA